MPAPVIYINAYPGTGKLTIARLLQNLIPKSSVLDNHSLIDPVEKRCPRGSATYQQERSKFRRKAISDIRFKPEHKDTIFIFTDSQTEHNDCMSDYTDLALGGITESRCFYSVILECALDENIRRLTSPGRGGTSNGKLTDEVKLREYRETGNGIFKFGDGDEIVLDVTELTAMEASLKISEFFVRREKEGKDWDEYGNYL